MLKPRKQFSVKVATRSGYISHIKYWAKNKTLVIDRLSRYSDIKKIFNIIEI
ncbi:hypothetical protein VCRLGP8_990058 [Vibrio crassostreae]|nr:hypothetical protein VCRLGP8_990058 [Vibrio crassostreae]